MFSIKFNFDPETEKISNLEVEKIKTIDEQIDGAVISIEDNKLRLSKDAVNLLNIKAGDRISINYYTVSPEETFPVIAESSKFTDSDNGNKITKSNTISFRGEQRKTLLRYGNLFKLEPFKNWFKLVKIEETVENDSLTEEENDLNNLEN